MKKTHKKSWVERKMTNPLFRKSVLDELEKLAIAEQLVQLRHAAGLSQEQLAKKIGTTKSAVSRYENAEYDRYEIQTLRKIVAACRGRLRIIIEPNAIHAH